MGNDIGITIIRAHANYGELYAEFEIRTDASGGFERYRWQAHGKQSALWAINALGESELIAEGELGTWSGLRETLSRVHSDRNVLTYGEFAYYVRGWIAGAAHAQPR